MFLRIYPILVGGPVYWHKIALEYSFTFQPSVLSVVTSPPISHLIYFWSICQPVCALFFLDMSGEGFFCFFIFSKIQVLVSLLPVPFLCCDLYCVPPTSVGLVCSSVTCLFEIFLISWRSTVFAFGTFARVPRILNCCFHFHWFPLFFDFLFGLFIDQLNIHKDVVYPPYVWVLFTVYFSCNGLFVS